MTTVLSLEKQKDLEKAAKRIAWLVLFSTVAEYLFARSFFANQFEIVGGLFLMFALEKTAIAVTLYVMAKFASKWVEDFRLDFSNYVFVGMLNATALVQFVVAIILAIAGDSSAAGIFTAGAFEITILGMVLFFTTYLAMKDNLAKKN